MECIAILASVFQHWYVRIASIELWTRITKEYWSQLGCELYSKGHDHSSAIWKRLVGNGIPPLFVFVIDLRTKQTCSHQYSRRRRAIGTVSDCRHRRCRSDQCGQGNRHYAAWLVDLWLVSVVRYDSWVTRLIVQLFFVILRCLPLNKIKQTCESDDIGSDGSRAERRSRQLGRAWLDGLHLAFIYVFHRYKRDSKINNDIRSKVLVVQW